MVDVKWFLYKYRQLVEAKKNTERAIGVLKKKIETPTHDENWWIKGQGGFPSSKQERELIYEDENERKIIQLERYLCDLDIIIGAIKSACTTLNKEQSDLIRLRYFEGNSVDTVSEYLNIDLRKYYRINNIAIEAMSICLGAFEISFPGMMIEEYIGKFTIKERREVVGKQLVPTL